MELFEARPATKLNILRPLNIALNLIADPDSIFLTHCYILSYFNLC